MLKNARLAVPVLQIVYRLARVVSAGEAGQFNQREEKPIPGRRDNQQVVLATIAQGWASIWIMRPHEDWSRAKLQNLDHRVFMSIRALGDRRTRFPVARSFFWQSQREQCGDFADHNAVACVDPRVPSLEVAFERFVL